MRKELKHILHEALSLIYKDLHDTKECWRWEAGQDQGPPCECDQSLKEWGDRLQEGRIHQQQLDDAFSGVSAAFTFYEIPLPEFDPQIGWVKYELDAEDYRMWSKCKEKANQANSVE